MSAERMKRLTARFYRTPAQNQPVRDWLMELAPADRRIVGEDMASVEFGWPLGMPLTRPIGKLGLREVRSTIKAGRVEARVIFGIDGDDMILLHGFEKRPSRQDNDIETAEDRWRDYRRRKDK
jgi:phage-related protein